MWYRTDGTDCVLELHVQPGAARSAFAAEHGGRLKLRLAAAAIDGRANAALVDFIAEAFCTSRRNVTIEAGHRDRRKRVRVAGTMHPPASLLASVRGATRG